MIMIMKGKIKSGTAEALVTHRNVEAMVGRFLDGSTTCAEERALYRYFQGKDVAPQVEKYRGMFAWYASELPMEDAQPAVSPAGRIRLRRWTGAAVAAMAAFAVVGAFFFYAGNSSDDLYACYEGSYVVINGKKITDIRKIMPELKRAELAVDEALAKEWEYRGYGDDDVDIDQYLLDVALRGMDDEIACMAIIESLTQ